jgi:hypothetical protein
VRCDDTGSLLESGSLWLDFFIVVLVIAAIVLAVVLRMPSRSGKVLEVSAEASDDGHKSDGPQA